MAHSKNQPAKKQLEEVIKTLSELSHEEYQDVLNAVQELINTRNSNTSITSLQGLGAEIWRSVDVQEYLNRERDSWKS